MKFAPPAPNLEWPIPLEVVYRIAETEQGPEGGFAMKAYRCQAGQATLGWGTTDGVRMGDTCTKDQADRWLCDDLVDRTRAVREMCKVDPSNNELGALVSLAYNIGVEGLRKSTALRQHNAGNPEAAARAFALWNMVTDPKTKKKVVSRGLTARRAWEASLYLTPDVGIERMPQAVEPESSLTGSPIAQSSAVITGTGVVAAVSQAADSINEHSGLLGSIKSAAAALKDAVHSVADLIGVPPAGLLAVVLIVAGYVIIAKRIEQRSEGWS